MKNEQTNKRENLNSIALSDFFDNDKFYRSRWFEKEFHHTLPPVNIKEDKKQFDIEFAAPGFEKNDFKVHIDQNVLTVSAEKKVEKNEENKQFTRKEFSYNTFTRSFTLPQTVDVEKIDAKYSHGILKLNIHKKTDIKTFQKKQIKID
jgi:HSP20 family protein